MKTQLDMFRKTPQPRLFALLELYEEKAYTADELLAALEPYTGPLNLKEKILAMPVYLVPNSNFFFMDVTDSVSGNT